MAPSDMLVKSAIGPSTDIGAVWNAAVVRYESTAGIKIHTLAGPTSVDEILIDSKEREKHFRSHRHDGSKLDKLRTLMRKALAPIEMWGNIATNATKALFPPSEVIFAAARYLISTANAVSADFDRVEEFFEELSSYLIQLKVWENKLPCIPELEEVITEVFTSVLILCGICTKYLRMKRLVKAFRALAGEDDELKSTFDQFRKTIQREHGIVRNAVLAGVQYLKFETSALHTDVEDNLALTEQIDRKTDHIVAGTNQIYRYFETQETAHERGNILAWLSSLDFHKKQRDTHGRHCSGTGNWFLNGDSFRRWLNSAHSSTLWCSGIPGAGKSVMTSVAISYVEEHTERRDVAIAYVYCDYTDSKLQSGIELISSITRQLVEQIHPIPQEVKAYRDRWAEKRSHPAQIDQVSLIKDIALRFSKTYIFVDALDECPERNRDDFLHMLRMLEPFTRLFITSRPHLELQTKFVNLFRIDIAASSSDIRVYLESEISTNSRMSLLTSKDVALKTQIIDTIIKKSAGMFLVAHFQFAHICRMSNPKKVRQSLDTLPTELYDFYEEALARIEDYPEEDRELVKKTLAYVYCARRPLKLEELRHALSIETHSTELDESAFPEMEIVFNISAGLIRVNEKSNAVVLVHHTLQEYLAKNSSKLLHHPEAEIAKTCLLYLSMDVFEQGPCIEGEILERRLKDYLFFDYASHYWGYHLDSNDLHLWTDLLLKFLGERKKLASYLQVLHIPRRRVQGWHDRFPKQFSPLHVVAYWGLHWVLKMHSMYGYIDSQDSHGTTALQLAAKHGHADVVQVLVESGAKLDIRNNRGETALYWAARSGHKPIVELLLAKGADAMIEDSEGWTALDWAVIRGYSELAQLLLDRCYHIDPEYSGANRALILAAEAGTEMTVQMLLDLGAEVNWRDPVGSTALAWAIPEGHEKVIRLLLDNGADVNSRDVYENTPLHWSLSYTEIAKLLLGSGAKVDAKNNSGKTALIWGAHDGQETALRLLLDNGANVAIQDYCGCTALHAAALRGHEKIVSILLENGSNPDARDQDGWTPLHAAAIKQHDEVVRTLLEKTDNGEQILIWVELQRKDAKKRALLAYMADRKSEGSTVVSGLGSAAQDGQFERVQALLETGINVDQVDACGSTALTLAVCQSQERIVRLLLEHGALVNKTESNGSSALLLAAENGHQEIIKLLVENGADVNGCIHTWTPLLIAAREGHAQTVEYLVRHGASINAEDYYGRKALHWIAQHGHWKTLKLLTEYGADIDAKDHWSRTPLMCAIQSKKLAAAKLLLDIGANIDSKTRDASTPLHMASYLGDQQMVFLLLQRGANVEAKTLKGFRSLHIAALFGHGEVVRLLLEKDKNIDAESYPFEADDGNHEDDDDEAVKDGSMNGYGTDIDDVVFRATLALDKCMQQRLVNEGKELDAPRSWTAQQLAFESGSRKVQELLAFSRRASKA